MEVVAFRDNYFPHLANSVYFANCSLGARSNVLRQALTSLLDDMGGDRLAWAAFEHQVHEAQQAIAMLLGAADSNVALMPNASVGAYQVASTLSWRERNKVVLSDHEFPSIAHVWLAQRSRGARCVFVKAGLGTVRSGADLLAQYRAEIDETTRLVSIPYASYYDGRVFPVRDIAAMAREVGALVFVDAYQALGIQAVDVSELDCDYLVGGMMKYLLGLPGLAFLYARRPAVNDQLPQLTGWFGRKNPFAFDPYTLDFPDAATRFQTGTAAIPAVYAANASLRMLAQLNMATVAGHVSLLTRYAAERLQEQGERLAWHPNGAMHGGHIALQDSEPNALTEYMADRHVTISPRGNVARLSFHYFNVPEEVDLFCDLLKKYRNNDAE